MTIASLYVLAISSWATGATPPGTLITLTASARMGNTILATVQKQIVVISPAAYPRAVYVCPRNVWVPLELGPAPLGAQWTVDKQPRRPLGVTLVEPVDTLANGWKVRRADGTEGIQLVNESLFTEHGLVE